MQQGPWYHFLLDCLSIVLIDLLLAGDNALVIAMAVRSLNARERRIGIGLGAAAAVVLRIVLTIAAARLLSVEFVKLLGGALVLWIAAQVFADAEQERAESDSASRFMQAIWFIVVADITMSTDNILAVAGASHGSNALIIFGLCLSIPFVVMSSSLLSRLMDRYPWVMYLGAGFLGKVGGEMIVTDPVAIRMFHPSELAVGAAEIAAVAAVFSAVFLLKFRRKSQQAI